MTQAQHKALAKKYADLVAARAMAQARGAPREDISCISAAIDEINAMFEADAAIAKRVLA